MCKWRLFSLTLPLLVAVICAIIQPCRVIAEELNYLFTQEIVQVTTDQDELEYKLKIEINSIGDIVRGAVNEQIYEGEKFLRDIKKGIVLTKSSGFNVVTLLSKNMDLKTGGQIEIKYLRSAIFKTYSRFYMQLVREGNQWVLYTDNEDKREIHRLHVI
ncbi:MAG: hypothetical protein HQK50_06225 [Oligoflexia bacterium]|nr:hypothetical protein [Oligoflexia bacterium]